MELFKSSLNTVIGELFYLWKKDNNRDIVLSIGIEESRIDRIIKSSFLNGSKSTYTTMSNKRSNRIEKSLKDYLTGECSRMDIDYDLVTGTDFQKKIWSRLSEVKYGDTISYKELGDLSGYPGSARAVGNAMAKNPLLIVIPCHRVLKKDGQLGGFSSGLKMKQYLLDLESGK